MREITDEMIKEYRIMKLRRDFMGYVVTDRRQLSFHHLIIPHTDSKQYGIGEGYVKWNGAILRQNTSHDYLHLVACKDRDIFNFITAEMVTENENGILDVHSWKRIDDALDSFEREHSSDRSKKGKLLIKEQYIRDRKIR
jgi:succinate dehydrogenase flavin-adding protein (antitoxin of CptAB toxin-antitoxin module)